MQGQPIEPGHNCFSVSEKNSRRIMTPVAAPNKCLYLLERDLASTTSARLWKTTAEILKAIIAEA
jgi:hypothetical protein